MAYAGSAACTWNRGSISTIGRRTPLRGSSVVTNSSGKAKGSCRLASRSSNFGPPSALAYSKTRNGTPADVVPETASSTLRTKPRPNGGAWWSSTDSSRGLDSKVQPRLRSART